MSVQIFLQGKILGVEEFLIRIARLAGGPSDEQDQLLAGLSHWVTLVSEVLPRALLAELGLAKILLGSSGGGQFLVVLPLEARGQAEDFLAAARRQLGEMSGGRLTLVWASTENLGDWTVVRRRLNEEMQRKRGTPAAAGLEMFEPLAGADAAPDLEYFKSLAQRLRETDSIGWSPEQPGVIQVGEAKHVWSLTAPVDGVVLARHAAPSDDSRTSAPVASLASRAEGRAAWGVLRGDVDNFGIRLRRAPTIEEYVQLSVMYKQFFAGELEVLCSMPEFWRKVAVLYSGGDDFAVYGAWDALIQLAREVHRLFRRFAEENLKDFPGPEGKTLSMALALAPGPDSRLADVFAEAGRRLEVAKSAYKDCFYLLGRTLEWKQVADAADLKDTMARMVLEFGCSAQFLNELSGFYRDAPETAAAAPRGRDVMFAKPWRLGGRLGRVLGASRDRELARLRASLVKDLLGKSAAHWKLRPAGRVALEWAKLQTEV